MPIEQHLYWRPATDDTSSALQPYNNAVFVTPPWSAPMDDDTLDHALFAMLERVNAAPGDYQLGLYDMKGGHYVAWSATRAWRKDQ